MTTRRKFLQLSTAALPLFARPLWAKKHIPLGLQLYTLRDLYPNDLAGILRQVRAIGYEEIELPGDLSATSSPKHLRNMIEESGLKAPSGHFDYKTFAASFDQAKDLGVDWMVISVIPPSMWTKEGFHQAAVQFNEWGKRMRELGLRFAFHNHDYEFRTLDGGGTGYEILIKETNPDVVFLEVDCYWVAQAGHDPVQLLKKLGKRARMLHLKDRKPGFPPTNSMDPESMHFTEVGSGTLNWPAILATAQELDMAHYFVEQDHTDGPALASVRKSYNYLRSQVG